MGLDVTFYLSCEPTDSVEVFDLGSGSERGRAVIHIKSAEGEITIFANPEHAIQIGEFCVKRGQELIAAREAKAEPKFFCEAVRGAA